MSVRQIGKPVTVAPVYRAQAARGPHVPAVYAAKGKAVPVVQRYTEVTATNPIGTLPNGARVSEHHKLVLMAQGSQNLYATPSRIQEGNAKLQNAGQLGSFVRLTAGTSTIQIPDPKRAGQQKTLHKVIPEWVQKPGVLAFDKAATANQPGGTAPSGYGSSAVSLTSGAGVPMAMNAECGAAACSVMGSSSRLEHVYKGGVGKKTGHAFHHANSEIEGERAMSKALWQFMQRSSNSHYLVAGVHYTTGLFGRRILIKPTDANPSAATHHRTMYDQLLGNGKAAFRRETGINQYANPAIGQSYNIRPDAKRQGWQKHVGGQGTWQHHYATVVMKDGSDNVTLENFNVIGQPINRDWIFNMYGTGLKQQTFHHYEKSVAKQFGTSATTMVARPT